MKVPLISAKEVNGDSSSGAREEGSEGTAGGAGAGADNLPVEVEEERRHNVEAAIVRIMKARKTLSHNELVMETTRQLSARFQPTPQVGRALCASCLSLRCVWHFTLHALVKRIENCCVIR